MNAKEKLVFGLCVCATLAYTIVSTVIAYQKYAAQVANPLHRVSYQFFPNGTVPDLGAVMCVPYIYWLKYGASLFTCQSVCPTACGAFQPSHINGAPDVACVSFALPTMSLDP